MDIQNWIIEWFLENTLANEEELSQGLTNNYFECEWIDSLVFISFLADIEDHFHVEFSNDMFQERDFSTIAGLAKIIEELL